MQVRTLPAPRIRPPCSLHVSSSHHGSAELRAHLSDKVQLIDYAKVVDTLREAVKEAVRIACQFVLLLCPGIRRWSHMVAGGEPCSCERRRRRRHGALRAVAGVIYEVDQERSGVERIP